MIGLLMFVARLGLRVGKWVTSGSSFLTDLVIALLALLPFIQRWRGSLSEYHPRYLKHAILITAPLIALLYIFGTGAILAYVSPDSVDVISAIAQALDRGFAGLGLAWIIVPVAILLLFTNYLSSFSLNFTGNSRLPMVAGWDHLLPEWFTRLHAKYRTPANSILFLGGVTVATSVVVLAGVGDQEAFELLQIWGFTFYGLTYLVLFAIPLLAHKERGIRPGIWLRFAAASFFSRSFRSSP